MAKNEPSPASPSAEPISSASGKGRATPSRKEREAANKRPLVPNDRRAAARASREAIARQREVARVGLAAGDERYLPRRDRGAQRRYVRDIVDSRFSIGELMVPLMLLVIVATFADSVQIGVTTIAELGILTMWGFVILVIVDGILLGFRVRRGVAKKFGAGSAEKGLGWYAAMRSIQMRPMRLPKPQLKRGQKPES